MLPESWYDDCIGMGDFESDSAFHVKQLDPFWHEARPIAYGAAGTHALPVAIERFASDAKFIEICAYRKRILPSPEGIESPSYPAMRELTFGNIDKEFELSVFTPRTDLEFLVAEPLYFENSVIGQYAAGHHRRDIVDYTSLAVETGVLDANSASEFLASKHFIPGGIELGIYPKSWLVHALSTIEVVGRKFLERYGSRVKKYDNQQIRAVGFCSERLGSFLLIRHLKERFSNNIPADIFGYITVMVEGNLGYSAGLAEVADRPKSSWYRSKRKRA